ncbi:isocitrate lyase/phosphoenolpyruvate mutase family protein [Kitasatospora sp. NPDC049285]|uniref:isocitrate lyase/PEP mutase family protein n=1 Tax=Kitasatospora sp. NPDC049285 TaxID=3157096 RepID=UPI00344167A5
MTARRIERARRLHALHRPGEPLVLTNVWDAATARLVEQAGAPALATASASVSWSLGVRDGGGLTRELAVAQLALVAGAVEVPVTADLEDGYAGTPAGVGETVAAALEAGAVGANLEDGGAGPGLRPLDDAVARVSAARAAADAAGVPLYLNARTDVYLHGVGEPADRLELALTRGRAFLAAGADGFFVPGIADPAEIAALAKEFRLNVLAGPGLPTVGELAALGVARISLGPGPAKAAYAAVRRVAEEVYGAGTYGALEGGLDYGELNGLFAN